MAQGFSIIAIILVLGCDAYAQDGNYLVKQRRSALGVTIEAVVEVAKAASPTARVLRSFPEILSEDQPVSSELYEEILVSEEALTPEMRERIVRQQESVDEIWPQAEARTLVQQGPSANRIDLTIVGDGYTVAEKDRFFADAQRLTTDLFGEQTFASYLPLFNVHAVFVPSQDSGLTDVARKNTALGLYRSPRGSKRAIMPGNSAAAERALRLAPDTDYPILVANDEFYGGLGGRYAITTRSLQSGSMVLRHELGHNFGEVGEEYDGGQVYRGANHSDDANLPWRHWTEGSPRFFEIRHLAGYYAWQNLSSGPFTGAFEFPAGRNGGDDLFEVKISSVGWKGSSDVAFALDEQVRELTGLYTEDRSFFRLKETTQLAPGRHSFRFTEQEKDGDNVLAYARFYAYPADIVRDNAFVGGYATFNDVQSHVGYRPTLDGCLMRDMRIKTFCTVDQENMWLKFLARVNLIDELQVNRGISSQSILQESEVRVVTPPLPGLRYQWFRLNSGRAEELPFNQTVALLPSGWYRVKVDFVTPEVLKPNADFSQVREFEIE